MYLDDLLSDRFWLLLTIIMAFCFIYFGIRNYQKENGSPFTPLGKYLLRLQVENNTLSGNDDEYLHIKSRIVRKEAMFSIVAGILMLVVILLTLVVL